MDFGELRQMLTDWASRIVRFTQIAGAASDGSATIAGRTYPGGPAAPSIKARLIFPFGFRSVPPSGVDAAVVHAAAASARGMIVGCDSAKYGPSDLPNGGAALYCSSTGAVVWFDDHGKLRVTSTSGQPIDIAAGAAVTIEAAAGANVAVNAGAGGKVTVNGGGRMVARDGDTAGPYPIKSTNLFFESG